MPAVYKLITTRPSLNDIFWIEQLDTGIYPITVAPVTAQVINCNMHYAEQITWQEISDRIDELRPDIKDWLLSRSSDAIHINATTLLNEYLDYDSTVIDNFLTHAKFTGTIPNYNPFSLTYTVIHTYNDVNTLAQEFRIDYRDRLDSVIALATSLNNTIVEEFYVDGVQITESEIPLV